MRPLGLILTLLAAALCWPTLCLLGHTGLHDAMLARQIEYAWQAPALGIQVFKQPVLNQVLVDVLQFALIGLMSMVFMVGWQNLLPQLQTQPEGQRLRTVLGWPVLAGLLLCFVVPFHSQDLYGYINRGAEQALFGLNPYTVTISQVPQWQQWAIFHAHWLDNPTPYGFVFNQATFWLVWLAHGSFIGSFLAFKLSNWLVFCATGFLLYVLAKILNQPEPERIVYLYAWNPLMLLHLLANGHNDGWMALGMLMALACVVFNNPFLGLRKPILTIWALPMLTLATLIKYAAGVAMPFLGLWLFKAPRLQVASIGIGGILTIVVMAWAAWPYVDFNSPWPWQHMLDNASMSQHSLHSMLWRSMFYLAKIFPALQPAVLPVKQGLKALLWLGFLGFYAWQVFQAIQAARNTQQQQQQPKTTKSLLWQSTLVVTVLVAFVSSKFHPWYVAMFLPLTLLTDENTWLFRFGLWLSVFQLLAFTPLENLHVFNYALLTLLPLFLACRPNSRGLLKTTP